MFPPLFHPNTKELYCLGSQGERYLLGSSYWEDKKPFSEELNPFISEVPVI